MGSDGVVVDPPGFDDSSCLRERTEDVFVEAFVAQPAVEGFHEGVLNRPAGCDVVPLYACLFDPPQHSVAGQLGPVV